MMVAAAAAQRQQESSDYVQYQVYQEGVCVYDLIYMCGPTN